MKRIYTVLAICAACTFTRDKKTDEHLTVQEHATQQGEQQAAETKTKGPTDITTNTETRQLAVEVEDPDGGIELALVSKENPLKLAPGSRVIGSVPLSETTVQRTEHQAGTVDTKASSATESGCEDVGLDLTKHTETKTKDAPALAGWLWIALAVAAVAGVGWVAWKFSLPGKVVSLAQKLLG